MGWLSKFYVADSEIMIGNSGLYFVLVYIICITPQITSLTESFLFFFQGRVSVADIIGFAGSEMISSKPEGWYI